MAAKSGQEGSGRSNRHDLGRALALDLGEKRIGVALSDETRTVARSLTVFRRSSRESDFQEVAKLIEAHDVTLVVVGLPVLLSGREGQKAAWVRDYAAELAKRLSANHADVEVAFWDESLSTVEAEANLRARGKSRKYRRQNIDAVAAAYILQSYLNAIAEAPETRAEASKKEQPESGLEKG
jgi:putative Holliday junction resolvase